MASTTRGRITAPGLQSVAQMTSTPDATSRARDLAGAVSPSCRDRMKTFSAASAKKPLLKPRSSEIQATLSTCSGCRANTNEQSSAAFRLRVSRKARKKQSHVLAT